MEDRADFTGQMSTQISHVMDNPEEFWIAHGVTGNPASVFVAADGSTELHLGVLGPQRLVERLKAIAVD